MIKVNSENKLVKFTKMTSMICDACGKEYVADNVFEIQEFHNIVFTGGYASVFGDGVDVRCDICQHCLYDMIHDFARYSNADV